MNEISTNRPLSLPTKSHQAGDALNDDQALAGWLGFVSMRNLQTHRSYKTETARFRIFLATVYQGTEGRNPDTLLRDASEVDVALYEAHLRGKMRTGEPVAPLRVPQHILNRYDRKGQPFITENDTGGVVTMEPLALKPSSINQAMSILHALYQHWMQPDPQTKTAYVGANPVKRVKTSSNRMQRQTSRNFPMEAVHAMLQALELHASTPPDQDVKPARHAQQMHHIARQRWVVALLFGLWGRRAEIASIQMADFRHDGIRWTVQLSRKGGKEQVLPVADWVMKELTRYRSAVGLSALPSSTEEGPAVGRVRDRRDHTGSVDADTIYRSITATAGLAARALRAHTILVDMDPVQRELVATRLDEISPHWFRHSGASIAINSGAMSLENASKMLGHSSTDITAGMYYHPDEGQIADGMEKLAAGAFG